MFEGDAPFIPEYINFLKSNKIQTAPLGAQCPSGTKVEPGPPDMKCQPCMPIELQNNMPRPSDELRRKMEAWQQNINKKATEMQQMKERDAGQKAAEMGGKMDQKTINIGGRKIGVEGDKRGEIMKKMGFGKSGFMQQPMGGSPAAYNVKQDTFAYLA